MQDNYFYETDDIEERIATMALSNVFSSIDRVGVTEDPMALICKSVVCSVPNVKFAYYCYQGEEVGKIAAIKDELDLVAVPPAIERKMVADMRCKSQTLGLSIIEPQEVMAMLPPALSKRWKHHRGVIVRVADGECPQAALLVLYFTPGFKLTSRHMAWLSLLGDAASLYLAHYRTACKVHDEYSHTLCSLSGSLVQRVNNQKVEFKDSKFGKWVETGLDSSRIKAIVGLRGSGKSDLLHAVYSTVQMNGVDASRVVFIDCENARFRKYKTADDVIAFLNTFPKSRQKKYLFLDEPGMVHWHTELLRKLQDMSSRWNVWIAASSDHVFSSLKAKDRMVYRAWLNSKVPRPPTDLEKIWCQIFMRDVVNGVDHPDIRTKEALAEYYSDHLGESKSLSDISSELTLFGRHPARSSIAAYRQALVDAHLIEVSEIYDVFEKSVIKSVSGRVFYTDLELRNWRFGTAADDDATRVELNRMYLDLRRKYGKVYTPRDYDADFVTVAADGNPSFWSIPSDKITSPNKFRIGIRGGGGKSQKNTDLSEISR